MEKLLDAINEIECKGIYKNEMVIIINSEYVRKDLEITNKFIETPITHFDKFYGIDVTIVDFFPFDNEFYIVTNRKQEKKL